MANSVCLMAGDATTEVTMTVHEVRTGETKELIAVDEAFYPVAGEP